MFPLGLWLGLFGVIAFFALIAIFMLTPIGERIDEHSITFVKFLLLVAFIIACLWIMWAEWTARH